jgi:hypothetical protein
MGKKLGSGSGIRDEQPGSYFQELRNHFFLAKILKSFDADPGSGMEKYESGIRDLGWKKFGSGINIPDPQHCNYSTFYVKICHCAGRGSNSIDFPLLGT